MFYSDSLLNVTQELLDIIDHNDIHYNTVTKLLDLTYDCPKKQWEVQAKRRGFDFEEPTWEPLLVIHEDISDMLRTFLDFFPDQTMVGLARKFLKHHWVERNVAPMSCAD